MISSSLRRSSSILRNFCSKRNVHFSMGKRVPKNAMSKLVTTGVITLGVCVGNGCFQSTFCHGKEDSAANQPLSPIESSKRLAAYSAVDEFVKNGDVVGIGSGSTVVYAVERLAQRVRDENLQIVCIPSSFQANMLIVENGLVLGDLNRYPTIDVAIDGADEVDSQLNCIKGGGGCQLQEKIVISNAKKFAIIADYRKDSQFLGENWKKGVPIEVVEMAYVPIMKKLEALGGTPVLRMAQNKAGPVVTDNGNLILDTEFGIIQDPASLEKSIQMIPGVVEVGLFCNLAIKAFFGQADGTVTKRTK